MTTVHLGMPALPQQLRASYEKEYGLSPQAASLLTESREKARFFERVHGKVPIELVKVSWLIYGNGYRQGWLRTSVKRLFDPDDLLNPGVLVDPRPFDAARDGSVLPESSYTRSGTLAGKPLTGLVDPAKCPTGSGENVRSTTFRSRPLSGDLPR